MWGCFLMSGVKILHIFERLMEIHSNSPKLYYGFNYKHSFINIYTAFLFLWARINISMTLFFGQNIIYNQYDCAFMNFSISALPYFCYESQNYLINTFEHIIHVEYLEVVCIKLDSIMNKKVKDIHVSMPWDITTN